MTREEYLKQLKNNIMSLTTDEQDEAIQYYSDYFEEADNDETVMAELGTPEELAKTIIDKCANALAKQKSSVKEDEAADSDDSSDNSTSGNGFGSSQDSLFFKFSKDSVKSLSINLKAAEAVIITGNCYAIETRGIERDAMTCTLNSEGTLIVNNEKRINLNFFNHNRNNRFVPRILITIPANAKLDKVRFAIGAGDCRAKDVALHCNYCNIDVGAGNMMIKSFFCGKADLRCGMGNINYDGTIAGSSNIDCGMGNITMNLKGDPEDYSYDAKVGLGDFKFNNEKKSGVGQVLNNHKKKNHFSVNCGMGSINIKLNK